MCVWTSRRKKREWMKTGLTGNIFSVMCTWHVIRYLSISSDSNYSAVLEIKIVLVTIQLSIYYLRGTLLSMLYVVTHLFLTRIQCGKHNYWRRQWHPTPVLLPGKSHRRRSPEDCSPWGRGGSDMTEWLPFHFPLSFIGEGNGNPLQCSCLENPRDGRAWWAAVYGVSQSRTRLKWLNSKQWSWGVFLS